MSWTSACKTCRLRHSRTLVHLIILLIFRFVKLFIVSYILSHTPKLTVSGIFELFLRFVLISLFQWSSRNLLCVSENCRFLQPALKLLYSSVSFLWLPDDWSFYSICQISSLSGHLELCVWVGQPPIISLIGRNSSLPVLWSIHWNNYAMRECCSCKIFLDPSDVRKIITSTFRGLICNVLVTFP